MAIDTYAIEAMLKDWSKRISATIGEMVVRISMEPLTEAEQEALSAHIRGWQEYWEGVEEQILALQNDRVGGPVSFFAGTWPPSNPLDLLAMREGLLQDYDALSAACVDYLGEEEDFGEGCGALGRAFAEVDAALCALTPETPEAATAIRFAWQADEELGFGDRWEEPKVKAAQELSLPSLPRAY